MLLQSGSLSATTRVASLARTTCAASPAMCRVHSSSLPSCSMIRCVTSARSTSVAATSPAGAGGGLRRSSSSPEARVMSMSMTSGRSTGCSSGRKKATRSPASMDRNRRSAASAASRARRAGHLLPRTSSRNAVSAVASATSAASSSTVPTSTSLNNSGAARAVSMMWRADRCSSDVIAPTRGSARSRQSRCFDSSRTT